ncbi:MAG TPA: hypothetical protein HA230_02945 [Candidatus Aenigmarchaeota archaeon]|nr:hypothetical protein [Candidatus Aenigmarchaeota archaeon]
MAKKSKKVRRTPRRAREKSMLTREEFFLNKHDEEKVLLFVTGLVFGMGLVATIMDKFLFGGLAMLVVGLVLLLLELNVEEKVYKI